MTKSQFVFISGVTSGIGYATAIHFAQLGYHIIGTGRRKERLQLIQNELEEFGVRVQMLTFDIRDREATHSALLSIPKEIQNELSIIVNNAGLAAGTEPIDEGDFTKWERMLDTNVKGLLWASECLIPCLKQNGGGTIINVGSIAGRMAYRGGNVYNASKYAVDGLTKAMRIDLLEHHIRVAQIAPGAVETEFSIVRYGGDEQQAKNVYKGFTPLAASDVAETIVFMATRPAHVCIQDVLIMPTQQADAVHFNKSE